MDDIRVVAMAVKGELGDWQLRRWMGKDKGRGSDRIH
jgi:hypothetical protein